MKHKPTIADAMTASPHTVHTAEPLSAAYDLIQSGEFHHVPVVDGKRPVGMISATDLLKLVYDIEGSDDRLLRTFLDHQFTIEQVMSRELCTVEEGSDLRKVAEAMSPGSVHSVLIVDASGDLRGVITSTDLIRVLAGLL